MRLLALSIVTPSGMNIADGRKRLEVRRWRPQALPLEPLLIVENKRFLRDDAEEDPDGLAVALVTINEVHPWREDEMSAACAGYFEPGLFAWTISNLRPIVRPFVVPARRGLYELDIDGGMLETRFVSE